MLLHIPDFLHSYLRSMFLLLLLGLFLLGDLSQSGPCKLKSVDTRWTSTSFGAEYTYFSHLQSHLCWLSSKTAASAISCNSIEIIFWLHSAQEIILLLLVFIKVLMQRKCPTPTSLVCPSTWSPVAMTKKMRSRPVLWRWYRRNSTLQGQDKPSPQHWETSQEKSIRGKILANIIFSFCRHTNNKVVLRWKAQLLTQVCFFGWLWVFLT